MRFRPSGRTVFQQPSVTVRASRSYPGEFVYLSCVGSHLTPMEACRVAKNLVNEALKLTRKKP